MHYCLLTCTILIVMIPSLISLECYVCNSNEDSACATASGLSKFSTKCKETVEPYCRKIVQSVDKITSVIRTCGSKTGAKACYKTPGTNTANVCSCNENLCNNAISLNRQQRLLTFISSIGVLAITLMILR